MATNSKVKVVKANQSGSSAQEAPTGKVDESLVQDNPKRKVTQKETQNWVKCGKCKVWKTIGDQKLFLHFQKPKSVFQCGDLPGHQCKMTQ
jgi:hypothetical protein